MSERHAALFVPFPGQLVHTYFFIHYCTAPKARLIGLIRIFDRRVRKRFEQELRQTRRRTQAGLTPGKDDNEVWHNSCRNESNNFVKYSYSIYHSQAFQSTKNPLLPW